MLGYDVSHHDHGEGLRKHEAKVQKPENTPSRPSSKWFSRKTLETYGHVCTVEKDKKYCRVDKYFTRWIQLGLYENLQRKHNISPS